METLNRWLRAIQVRIEYWMDIQMIRFRISDPDKQAHREDIARIYRELKKQPIESLAEKHKRIAAEKPIGLTYRQMEALIHFIDDRAAVEKYRQYLTEFNSSLQKSPLRGVALKRVFDQLVEYCLLEPSSTFFVEDMADGYALAVSPEYVLQTLEHNYQQMMELDRMLQEHQDKFQNHE